MKRWTLALAVLLGGTLSFAYGDYVILLYNVGAAKSKPTETKTGSGPLAGGGPMRPGFGQMGGAAGGGIPPGAGAAGGAGRGPMGPGLGGGIAGAGAAGGYGPTPPRGGGAGAMGGMFGPGFGGGRMGSGGGMFPGSGHVAGGT